MSYIRYLIYVIALIFLYFLYLCCEVKKDFLRNKYLDIN